MRCEHKLSTIGQLNCTKNLMILAKIVSFTIYHSKFQLQNKIPQINLRVGKFTRQVLL